MPRRERLGDRGAVDDRAAERLEDRRPRAVRVVGPVEAEVDGRARHRVDAAGDRRRVGQLLARLDRARGRGPDPGLRAQDRHAHARPAREGGERAVVLGVLRDLHGLDARHARVLVDRGRPGDAEGEDDPARRARAGQRHVRGARREPHGAARGVHGRDVEDGVAAGRAGRARRRLRRWRRRPGRTACTPRRAPARRTTGSGRCRARPWGTGDASPALQTVLMSAALSSVFVLRSSIEASRPVSPTVTTGGKLGTALAPTPACATPGSSAMSVSGASTQNARILTVSRAPLGMPRPLFPWFIPAREAIGEPAFLQGKQRKFQRRPDEPKPAAPRSDCRSAR